MKTRFSETIQCAAIITYCARENVLHFIYRSLKAKTVYTVSGSHSSPKIYLRFVQKI